MSDRPTLAEEALLRIHEEATRTGRCVLCGFRFPAHDRRCSLHVLYELDMMPHDEEPQP